MKYSVLFSFVFILICSFGNPELNTKKVTNKQELEQAIAQAKPGDNIILANGIWKDIQIKFVANGTKEKPITIKAETPGKVLIQGQSDLKLAGEYLVVDGLYFTNGYTPSKAVIEFAVSSDQVANHSTVVNCVIEDYNQLQRDTQDLWVLFKGRHNQLDQCYLAGKSNKGPTIRINLAGNQNIYNYHKITNNHFGPRPPKGGPSAETIQLGDSYTSMTPSYTLVENNIFEHCDGEVEIISSKSNFNEFRNNVFFKSEGSLVTRHGNYCIIDGNYFIGDGVNESIGGIRLIGTGHKAVNNYFYNLKGQNFRSPLAVMNGIPKSPLNRYIQVTDVVVAYNSWINCVSPLQFGVGSNISQKDVLPASEIRSETPIRTTVANNLIYNENRENSPIVKHDSIDGITFKSNVINAQSKDFKLVSGFDSKAFTLTQVGEYIWEPSTDFPKNNLYNGFEFDAFKIDLFGNDRANNNVAGAIIDAPESVSTLFSMSNYGPKWFVGFNKDEAPKNHKVKKGMDLSSVIAKASNNDVIEIQSGTYKIPKALKIDKALTIMSKGKVNFVYEGAKDTALFEMHPKGELTLKGISLKGNVDQMAFASLKENMSSLYNLTVDNCQVEGFNYVLKGYKYSFARHLNFKNSTFENCQNGIELSEETDDKGEYNAENIVIDNCVFDNISQNVVDYYRGGYDESTVGGTLSVLNSTFMNCGEAEKNGILLNTYGIINVHISGNTFKDNKVKQVAQLWGAKNNTHSNNKISNSGKIVVEENLKLNLLY